ncbi:hypothetical protein ACFE04_006108 [Oxalis oulophora]
MGKPTSRFDYETIRNDRILANQAKLEALGLHKTISDLRSATSPTKPRKPWARVFFDGPLRRSSRLKGEITPSYSINRPRRSKRLNGNPPGQLTPLKSVVKNEDGVEEEEEEEKRPANMPLVCVEMSYQPSPEDSARRCHSKGRGSVYNPVYGICCHFCRQKKMCGEEDCKRCGDLDVNQPCLGKTDCSVCHSSTGVFCRACLKVRYGEEIEEVRENKQWMCPHCIEEKGARPYWICNSSREGVRVSSTSTHGKASISRQAKMKNDDIAAYKVLNFGDAAYLSTLVIVYPLNQRGAANIIMAVKSDHYKTLNVGKTATLQEIKNSYRKLARKYHPDISKALGAEDKFKEISCAYEVLSDSEKRAVYDRYGEEGLQGEFNGSGNDSEVDPFDIYNTFFGGSDGLFGGMRDSGDINFNFMNKRSKDLDIRYNLTLTLEESVFGGERKIEFSCFETCGSCGGSGAKSSNCIQTCSECGGRGGVMKTQRTPFGVMSQLSSCFKCNGYGKVITDHCPKCEGNGRVQSKRKMSVVIPPGVYSGATMQIRGEGNFDKENGFAGDLYIIINVTGKHGIRRDGLNLISEINIDYTDAILGTEIKVETVEGTRDLKIPPGIQPGDTVKLTRMGIPDVNKPSVRGDHQFVLKVSIPRDISNEERALIKELSLLKSYRKDSSASSKKFGTVQGNFEKDDATDQKNQPSSKEKKRGASVWNSIKSFLGQGKSNDGFASVSVATPESLWGLRKQESSHMMPDLVRRIQFLLLVSEFHVLTDFDL